MSLGEARPPRLFPEEAESCCDPAHRLMAVDLMLDRAVLRADLGAWGGRVHELAPEAVSVACW